MIKEKLTCPLGSECTKMIDSETVEKCMWFVKLAGVDGTGQEVETESCAIRWLPVLQVEMSNTNRGQTAALESLRNETVSGQQLLNAVARNTDKGLS